MDPIMMMYRASEEINDVIRSITEQSEPMQVFRNCANSTRSVERTKFPASNIRVGLSEQAVCYPSGMAHSLSLHLPLPLPYAEVFHSPSVTTSSRKHMKKGAAAATLARGASSSSVGTSGRGSATNRAPSEIPVSPSSRSSSSASSSGSSSNSNSNSSSKRSSPTLTSAFCNDRAENSHGGRSRSNSSGNAISTSTSTREKRSDTVGSCSSVTGCGDGDDSSTETHYLWLVSDPQVCPLLERYSVEYFFTNFNLMISFYFVQCQEIEKLQSAFASVENLYIADGHHRTEASCK
jgi:hypothetical protein